MIHLKFGNKPEGLKILCIGAHCDDIEIGCGGTLLKLFRQYPIAQLTWVVFTSDKIRAQEAQKSADIFLKYISQKEIVIHTYQDAFLNYSVSEVKKEFEALKRRICPDIIFTHCRVDQHPDHRLLGELTRNTFKNHLIWEYEIPKHKGELGRPNVYVHLDEKIVEKKVTILTQSFQYQIGKHWHDPEMFKALMRLRGIESAAPFKYAEAFHANKTIL